MASSGRLVIKHWRDASGRGAAAALLRRAWPEADEAGVDSRLDALPLSLPLDITDEKAPELLGKLAAHGVTAEFWPAGEDLPMRLSTRPRIEFAEVLSSAQPDHDPASTETTPKSRTRMVLVWAAVVLVLAVGLLVLPHLADWLAAAP